MLQTTSAIVFKRLIQFVGRYASFGTDTDFDAVTVSNMLKQ